MHVSAGGPSEGRWGLCRTILFECFLPTGVRGILRDKDSLTNGAQRSCILDRVWPLPACTTWPRRDCI
jgi:hypothetical protein